MLLLCRRCDPLESGAQIKRAFNEKYLNRETAIYGTGVQTALSAPLYWGLVPVDMRGRVAANLAARVEADSFHMDVGWWITNGATTLYENWKIDAQNDISLNHIMFGEIGAWLYKGPAGDGHVDRLHGDGDGEFNGVSRRSTCSACRVMMSPPECNSCPAK